MLMFNIFIIAWNKRHIFEQVSVLSCTFLREHFVVERCVLKRFVVKISYYKSNF